MRSTLRVSTAAALLLSARPAFPLSVQAEGGDVTVARSGVAGEVLRQLVHRASDDDDDDDSSAEQAYLDSVCSPESWDGDEVPPCIEISTIQSVCTPNGTSTLDLEAHAQCVRPLHTPLPSHHLLPSSDLQLSPVERSYLTFGGRR